MERTSGADIRKKALYYIVINDCLDTFVFILYQSLSNKIGERPKIKNADRENCWNVYSFFGIVYFVAPKQENRLRYNASYRKIRRGSRKELLRFTVTRQMHRQLWNSKRALAPRRQLRTLTNEGRQKRHMQDENRHTGWTVWVHLHAVRAVKHLTTFKQIMKGILVYDRWQHVLVYIGDVFLFFKTAKKYLNRFKSIIQLVGKAGRTLEPKTRLCYFDAISYLGPVILSKRFTSPHRL